MSAGPCALQAAVLGKQEVKRQDNAINGKTVSPLAILLSHLGS